MNFKEKLTSALKDSVKNYNTGDDANLAIVKAAKAHNFNKDQTDRLVETFNTARTINYYKEKSAGDRTGSFDMADKNEVVKLMLDPEEKKAEASSSYDYSCYSEPEKNYVSRFSKSAENALEKTAEHVSSSETTGLSREALSYEAVKAIRLCKQAADAANDSIGKLKSEMISTLYKLAEKISSGYDPEERYSRFKAACADMPIVVKNLEKVLPSRFSKVAESSDPVVDDSDLSEEKDLAEEINDMSKHVDSFRMMSISWSKKGEDLQNEFNKAIGLTKDPSEKKASDLLKTSGLNLGIPQTDEKIEASPEKEKFNNEVSKAYDQMVRQDILQDLMLNDPIISEADPRDVVQIYDSLLRTSPRQAMNKAFVRSILISATNSVATSPYDIKTWAEVEKETNQAKNNSQAKG